jgi:hypothetical protein
MLGRAFALLGCQLALVVDGGDGGRVGGLEEELGRAETAFHQIGQRFNRFLVGNPVVEGGVELRAQEWP